MTDTLYVLDASAVLAAFFDEPGADHIAARMNGALISAVNYSEVVAKLIDRGTPHEQILEIMAQLDVDVVPVDRDQAMSAGLLRAETRSAGLSLGDRSCLALALARGAVALTADRAWGGLTLGVTIEVVR
ncbi:type II toxin-antitoxin system VapC family toxin [Sphingomonas sp. BIUV-7]|uniref:Type II toxin-antitoxin system VapC family toxin n=1 Tax=Sphingomonas natans TaxID=3063330 RepID=A0ABT8Y7V2_9SPHN|nr:type II toxin-antitoxin system VapC family toxin [Sphingomonas sp. BIUV-7]MDO6414392.1 type II toxin-antitoxin system VapC family toxin [Sphingomonas sp. BIUV-7]